MNRDMFVRVAILALRQNVGRSPEAQAEAIALLMDTVVAVIGEGAGNPPARTDAPVTRVAFPAINPEAIAPVAPEPEPPGTASGYNGPPLIIQSTTMPDRSVRRSEPPPAASLLHPVQRGPKQARMKVEDLSRLVQERTPPELVFDVPMEDGTQARVIYPRNVVSMHAYDSVQLIYSPLSAMPSAREAAEVTAVLHVDDVPFDLGEIIKGLKSQAISSIRPRRPIVEREPAPSSGPVKHSQDTYVDPAAGAVQAVFNSMDR